MKLRPLHDRILAKRVEEESQTKGGILIPDTAKEKPQRAVVVAVGEGKRGEKGARLSMPVAAGDTVLFPRFAGTEVEVDGEEHLILRQDDVLAILG